jgi:DNA polymerase III epsilon subunit-like protein
MVWVGGGVRRRRLRQRLRVILQLPSCRRVRGPEMAFFDVETSMPQRADQGYALLEFGAVLVCPRRLVEVASYATLVRPADPVSAVSAASVRCNGITRDAVSGAPPFRDVADAVYDLLNGELLFPPRRDSLPCSVPSYLQLLAIVHGSIN